MKLKLPACYFFLEKVSRQVCIEMARSVLSAGSHDVL